ncbi:MAG: family 43 glycosylhydrolase [Spirochaetales bacterium]|nr:family 43 glycosylhydrolase [Spirochaetales bacterium]
MSEQLSLPWKLLKNPVLSIGEWAIKDPCMVFHNGEFFLFFSAFYEDEDEERSHIICVKTRDFTTFSDPLFVWDGKKDGWSGLCSPNISEIKGKYYLTYNSWGEIHSNGKRNSMFYAVSPDLASWQKDIPLAHDVSANARAIDPALAEFNGNWYLVFKGPETPFIVTAKSIDGPWRILGVPDCGWLINGEFIYIDGSWYLVGTARGLVPFISRMKHSGEQPDDWIAWEPQKRLMLPLEHFNTCVRTHCIFIYDNRKIDNSFYALYVGSTENISHLGRGNCRLGIACSPDLVSWYVPPHLSGEKVPVSFNPQVQEVHRG